MVRNRSTRMPARSSTRCTAGRGPSSNAAPYGSIASWPSGGRRSASPRASATHAAVLLGVPSRIAARQLVRHPARALEDLVVLLLDGSAPVFFVHELEVVVD